MVLMPTNTSDPGGDVVQSLYWVEVARAQDVDVVILTKQCSSLCPGI